MSDKPEDLEIKIVADEESTAKATPGEVDKEKILEEEEHSEALADAEGD